MDANELAMIAIDALPTEDMSHFVCGEVGGIIKMALRTLEVQHEALLAEADDIRDAMRRERDGWQFQAKELGQECNTLVADLRTVKAELAAAIAARDASGADYTALADSFATMRQERDKLSQQCDSMAAEIDAKQKELEWVRDDLELSQNLNVRTWQAVDATLTKEAAAAVRDEYRAMTQKVTLPPGAVQVAQPAELHGMADVYAQGQRMSNAITPSKPVSLVPPGSEDL